MQHFEDRLASAWMRAIHGIHSSGRPLSSMVGAVAAALVWLVVSLPISGGAWAGESEPADGSEPAAQAQLLVQNTISRVLAAMSRDKQQDPDRPTAAMAIVDKIVMPNVDLELVSQLVLGKHWRRASLVQRERFKREFGTQLLRTYAIGVIDYLILSDKLGTEINYLPPTLSDDRNVATVRSKVGRSTMQVRIDYRLYRRDETWKVYDVLVDGVSTVRTYRNSFIAETTRNGIDSLTDQIATKNRQYGSV